MNTVHTTRDDAIRALITTIENTGVVSDARTEYDIEALADEVIGTLPAGGYGYIVDPDEFWAAVARYDRDPLHPTSAATHACLEAIAYRVAGEFMGSAFKPTRPFITTTPTGATAVIVSPGWEQGRPRAWACITLHITLTGVVTDPERPDGDEAAVGVHATRYDGTTATHRIVNHPNVIADVIRRRLRDTH